MYLSSAEIQSPANGQWRAFKFGLEQKKRRRGMENSEFGSSGCLCSRLRKKEATDDRQAKIARREPFIKAKELPTILVPLDVSVQSSTKITCEVSRCKQLALYRFPSLLHTAVYSTCVILANVAYKDHLRRLSDISSRHTFLDLPLPTHDAGDTHGPVDCLRPRELWLKNAPNPTRAVPRGRPSDRGGRSSGSGTGEVRCRR